MVAEAVAGGVDWIQLRERDLDGRALCELADRVVAAARRAAAANGRAVRVLINRRADIALAAGADGVLMNTAIAGAKDPVAMATAMKLAVEAGRLAFKAGRIGKKLYATASSPLEGVPEWTS